MGEITIVPYDSERIPEIVDLMNLALGRTDEVRRDVAYWLWKHEQNPFGRSLVLLGEIDGRLVGMRSFLRWELQVNGRIVGAAKPVDTVTHPDFQRRGIFSQLTKAAIEQARNEGVRLLFNTPNANSLPGYLKLGWKTIAELPIRVCIRRPGRIARCVLFGAHNPAEFRSHDFVDSEVVTAESAVRELAPLDVNDAWVPVDSTKSESDAVWRTPRSLGLLDWRYTQHPHQAYFAYIFRGDSGTPAGVAFMRCRYRRGIREVMLCDVLAEPQTPAGKLSVWVAQLKKHIRADLVMAHAADTSLLGDALRRNRFFVVPKRRITLVGNVISEERPLPDLLVAENWSLVMGDIEGL